MKELKGTRTETNLMAAFSAESMARVKYGFYGEKAHDDGYVQIGDIFDETASNENEHAEIWFKLLSGGKIRGTADNLADAIKGENYEWSDMYDEFAREADERGAGLLRRHFRSRHARMARPGVGQRYCPARMDSGVAFLRYPVAEQTAYKLEAG